jgi:hypothetical protein
LLSAWAITAPSGRFEPLLLLDGPITRAEIATAATLFPTGEIRSGKTPGLHRLSSTARPDGETVEDRQRQCLIEEFQGFVADISTDVEPDGSLTPKNARWVGHFSRAVEWLRGVHGPGSELRDFFEERLEVYDREASYHDVTYEP